MQSVKERLVRLLEAPPERDIADDFRDRWMVRNATLLIGAVSSFAGVFVFMAIGSANLYIMAAVVGVGFVIGFVLSRRGYRRLACLVGLVPLELALLDAREQGVYHRSHLFHAACVPLSSLELVLGDLVPRRSTPIGISGAAGALLSKDFE